MTFGCPGSLQAPRGVIYRCIGLCESVEFQSERMEGGGAPPHSKICEGAPCGSMQRLHAVHVSFRQKLSRVYHTLEVEDSQRSKCFCMFWIFCYLSGNHRKRILLLFEQSCASTVLEPRTFSWVMSQPRLALYARCGPCLHTQHSTELCVSAHQQMQQLCNSKERLRISAKTAPQQKDCLNRALVWTDPT